MLARSKFQDKVNQTNMRNDVNNSINTKDKLIDKVRTLI